MSRVEPEEHPAPQRQADRRHEPEKAEGDEKTVEEALRNQEEKKRRERR